MPSWRGERLNTPINPRSCNHAETLAEARAVLKRNLHPAPNMVLSDLRLPDGTALELLQDGIPLVITTSQGDEQ